MEPSPFPANKPSTPIAAIGPSGPAKVPLQIDESIKTDPPVATIERFDASGGILKIGCPGGMVTIDASVIGGKSFALSSETNVARMFVTGLVDLFSVNIPPPEKRDPDKVKLNLNLPEKFHIAKDPTAYTTAKIVFGVNGENNNILISKREVLEDVVRRLMALAGGTLAASAAAPAVDATAPDALKNTTAPSAAATVAPVQKPEVVVKVPSLTPAPAAVKVPVPAAPGSPVKLSIAGATPKPAASAPAPAPVAETPAPIPMPPPPTNVGLKGTQKINVPPAAPAVSLPMTPATLRLSDGIVFQTTQSETKRAIFIDGNTAYVFRKGKDDGEWSPEFRLDNVEHIRKEFAAKWGNNEVSYLPNHLDETEIATLKARCVRDAFPALA